ncbi:MAG: hypothetical protein ACO28Q_10210 [Ilumatobacteraceae bacterium]
MSAALFEVIGHVEVILRNAIHTSMSAWGSSHGFGSNWYDNSHGLLGTSSMTDISRAIERLRRSGKSASPDRLVSELNFGFWRYLLSGRYRSSLWALAMRNAFPHAEPASFEKLFNRVRRLHLIRNRVAHHEPIFSRRIDLVLLDAYLVVRAIDPEIERWVRERSRVEELLIAKP